MARFIWMAILAAILQAPAGCAGVAISLDQKQVASTEQLGVLVEAAPQVTIIVPNGSVRLHAGESGRVSAVATRHGYGRTSADAQAAHDGLEVAFTQAGPEVVLEARRLGDLAAGQSDEAELDVTVPVGASVTISVANGEIVAAPTGAGMTADVKNGTITINPARGDSFRFSASIKNGTIQSAYPQIPSTTGQDSRTAGDVGDEPEYTVEASCANGIIVLNKAQ